MSATIIEHAGIPVERCPHQTPAFDAERVWCEGCGVILDPADTSRPLVAAPAGEPERFVVGTVGGLYLAPDGAFVWWGATPRVFTDRGEAEAVADAFNVRRRSSPLMVLPYTVPTPAAPAPVGEPEPTTVVQRARAALRAAGYPAEWFNTGGGCMVLRFEHGAPVTAPWGETHRYEVMVSPDDGPFGYGDLDADSGEVTGLAAVVYTYDDAVQVHDQDTHRVLTVPLDQSDPYTELVAAVAALLTPREG